MNKFKLDVVIPTLNRRDKLINCLNSIRQAKKDHNIEVYIYFSNVKELLDTLNETKDYWISCRRIANYRVPDFWNNHLKTMCADAMLCCNDDVLFKENTIDKIMEHFCTTFPDYDGIVGINQENLPQGQGKHYAFMIIGSKFANRFPDRNCWCPDYYRFYADQELGTYADKIGKFKYCPEIKIIHLHPCFNKELLDDTHRKVRKFLAQDKIIYEERRNKDLLWGRDFKLIGEKQC